jgi:hypothetical protein
MPGPQTVVFVHGWSVTHTDTYGGLPERLAAEAAGAGERLDLRDVWLARYVSFRDEVRVEDLSRAMEAAVRRELFDVLARGARFAVITHSTGGPVARDWWLRHYAGRRGAGPCPMSHLVMLAPASFGSALAQLGKGRVGRLRSWLEGVEPGQGVLDWLELGSPEAWELNEAWIRGRFGRWDARGVFPFVLAGETIDRKLYDHLNAYTGESGSDGVVRVAAANLNATLVRLAQPAPAGGATPAVLELAGGRVKRAPRTAFRVVSGAAHSGEAKGILRSVAPDAGGKGAEVVDAVRRALAVTTPAQYKALCRRFDAETAAIQERERTEVEPVPILPDRTHIHDRASLVLFRVRDSAGHPLEDFDLELTGPDDDPDLLPQGFFKDRQRNGRARNTLAYFLNHDLMTGCPAVVDPRDPERVWRPARPGIDTLGLRVTPRPTDGFVHYAPGSIAASAALLHDVVRPNETTLVDVVLERVVHEGVYRASRATEGRRSFRDDGPGPALEG